MSIQFTALDTFLEGRVRFEKGGVYEAPEEFVRKFVANGWAAAEGLEPPTELTAEHVIEVHSSTLGTT